MGQYWVGTGKNRHRTAAGNRHEYEKFQSSAKAKAERASRNSARRFAIRKGLVHKGDGKDIDHRNSNPLDNRPSNIHVMSASENRGKKENSRRRGSRRVRWGK